MSLLEYAKEESLRVNVGKSKVMRCSRYGNGDRMHVILNCEPPQEVNCFKYLGSHVAADGGCERDVVHRMNEGHRAWGALTTVLSNRGLGIKAKKVVSEKSRSESIEMAWAGMWKKWVSTVWPEGC